MINPNRNAHTYTQDMLNTTSTSTGGEGGGGGALHPAPAEENLNDCAVCKDTYGGRCLKLPCGHLFHQECITTWLKQHNNCPICRAELPSVDPDYEAQRGRAPSNSNSSS